MPSFCTGFLSEFLGCYRDRVGVQGRALHPDFRYLVRMTVDSEARRIELRVDDKGDRVVSRRERRGQALPIIDIANAKALSTIPADSVLRIDFSAQKIVIEMSATDRRATSLKRSLEECSVAPRLRAVRSAPMASRSDLRNCLGSGSVASVRSQQMRVNSAQR